MENRAVFDFVGVRRIISSFAHILQSAVAGAFETGVNALSNAEVRMTKC